MTIQHPLRGPVRTAAAIKNAPANAIYLARHHVDPTELGRPDITFVPWANRYQAVNLERLIVIDPYVHEFALDAGISDYQIYNRYYQFVIRADKRLLDQEAHLTRISLYSAIGSPDPFEYAKRGSAMTRYQPCFIVAFDHGEPIVCTYPAGRYHRRPVTEYHFRPYTGDKS